MLCEQQLSRIFITSIRRPAMPIISIKTNCTLDTAQQQQLLKQVVVVTSETLAVEKERIDVSLQILPSGLTITGGVQKRLFVRYTVARSEERRVGKECRSRGSPYNKRRKGRHKRGEEMMKQ